MEDPERFPLPSAMTRLMPRRLDPATTESLLAGTLHPEDAPPGYARLASLLGEAAHARAHRERTTTPATSRAALGTVAAMREALATSRQPATQPRPSARSVGRGQPLPARRSARIAKVPAALAGVGLLVVATGGAAVAVAMTSPTGRPVAASNGAPGQRATRAGAQGQERAGHEAAGGTHPSRDAHPGKGSDAVDTRATSPNAHATFGLCTAEASGAGAHRNAHAPALPSAATCTAIHHPGGGYGRPSWSLPPGGAAYLPPSTAPGAHPGGPGRAGSGTPARGGPPVSPGPGTRTPAGTSGA